MRYARFFGYPIDRRAAEPILGENVLRGVQNTFLIAVTQAAFLGLDLFSASGASFQGRQREYGVQPHFVVTCYLRLPAPGRLGAISFDFPGYR